MTSTETTSGTAREPDGAPGALVEFLCPTRVLFGVGAADRVGHEAVVLGGRQILLVTEPGVAAAGLTEPVERSLADAGCRVTVFDGVVPNPDVEGVDTGARLARRVRAEVLVGVGGGSALDTAKLIGLLLVEGGETAYRYFREPAVAGPTVPLIAVPTTAGTGSEVAWAAVMNRKETGERLSLQSPHLAARVAVVDPTFAAGLPPKLAAGTGLDALAHAIEGYTSTTESPFGDAFALEAIRRIGAGLVPLVTERDASGRGDLDAAGLMASASTLAGFVLNYKGVNLGHAMGRSLSTWYGLHHGTTVGVLLPTIMAYNLVGNEARFAEAARALGVERDGRTDGELARAGVERVTEMQRRIGAPATLRELGVPREDLDRLTDAVIGNPRLLAVNPRSADRAAVRDLYAGLLG